MTSLIVIKEFAVDMIISNEIIFCTESYFQVHESVGMLGTESYSQVHESVGMLGTKSYSQVHESVIVDEDQYKNYLKRLKEQPFSKM